MARPIDDPGGIPGMGPLEIVVRRASYTVGVPRNGLWILSDPWKTHRTSFPPVLGRAQDARPQGPQALIVGRHEEGKHTGER